MPPLWEFRERTGGGERRNGDTVNGATDQELISQVLAGTTDSFGVLVERYQHRLYRSLLNQLRDPATAEDATQDALILAFQKLGAFRGESAFFSWLFRIGMNAAANARRRTSRVVHLSEHQDRLGDDMSDRHANSDPAHRLELDDRQSAVRQALDAMAPEFRVPLILKEIDGLKYEEIADMIDCPIGTVRSRIHRARIELRERLAPLMRAGTI